MEIQSLRQLRHTSDWVEAVGAKNYRKGYSAYETHQKWKAISDLLPEPLNSVLLRSRNPIFTGIKPDCVIAEHAVFLDTLKTPSKTDIMAFCSNEARERIVLAVEAKCAEPFAERISRWITTPDAPRRLAQRRLFTEETPIVSRKVDRLRFLNSVLGTDISPESHLRYQLLHRTASAILEARNLSARAAVVVVQAFTFNIENFFDFTDWTTVLGIQGTKKNTLLGPFLSPILPSTPIYFLYLQDQLSDTTASLF